MTNPNQLHFILMEDSKPAKYETIERYENLMTLVFTCLVGSGAGLKAE